MSHRFTLLVLLGFTLMASAADPQPLPGTKPLTETGDLSARLRKGLEKFLLQELDRASTQRLKRWEQDLSSVESYRQATGPSRDRFRRMIGVVDERLPIPEL